jgi:hypothetical protein
MAVEHAHEDGNARERPDAELEFLRRHRIGHAAHAAVGRRDQDAFSRWCNPRRIAEEIRAPERRDDREPAERRPQPQQHQRNERESADEGIALRMNRRKLRADRADDGHASCSIWLVDIQAEQSEEPGIHNH